MHHKEFASATRLKDGQLTGTIAYLSAGGNPDLFAVDKEGTIWLLSSGGDEGPPMLEVALSAGMAGPLTVTVSTNKSISGMFVVCQGRSVRMGVRSAGVLVLEWQDPSGRKHQREVSLKTGSRCTELGSELNP